MTTEAVNQGGPKRKKDELVEVIMFAVAADSKGRNPQQEMRDHRKNDGPCPRAAQLK